MGDRGNVYITNTSTEGYTAPEFQAGARGIYLYSHWDGRDLPAMVRDALADGAGRWGDDEYLTRIIIDQVTRSGRDQETGYGVGLTMLDNSYPITIVDLGRQEVAWADPGDERDPAKWVSRISFKEFADTPRSGVAYPAELTRY
jgi:hypothetical protein